MLLLLICLITNALCACVVSTAETNEYEGVSMGAMRRLIYTLAISYLRELAYHVANQGRLDEDGEFVSRSDYASLLSLVNKFIQLAMLTAIYSGDPDIMDLLRRLSRLAAYNEASLAGTAIKWSDVYVAINNTINELRNALSEEGEDKNEE